MIQNHRTFQGYHFFHLMDQDRHAREIHRGHPAFARTCRLCDEWDQTAFDPGYDTMPIDAFKPMVHRLFNRAPNRRS
jgi:predicted HD phosphohydrolase